MSEITTLYINSKDRVNGTSSNFNYNLFPLGVGENNTWVFKNITIPFTFYVTVHPSDAGTDQTFEVEEQGNPPFNITVPVGNYSATQLSALLKNLLDAASPSGAIYTVTINPNNYKTTITTNGVNVVFNWGTSNIGVNTPYKRLGAVLGWYDPNSPLKNTINAVLPVGPSKTSPQVYNLSGYNSLYLKSSTLNLGSVSFLNAVKNNVVAEIPVTSSPGGIIFYQNELDIEQPFNVNQTSYIDFQLVDEYDNEIDLNGENISFSLILRNNSSY